MTPGYHDPVPLDIAATRERWSKDPTFAESYGALRDEFVALDELMRARQLAKMPQTDGARPRNGGPRE
jgi:hypothetical protein